MNEKNEEKRNLRIGSCCRGDDGKTNVALRVKSQKNSLPKILCFGKGKEEHILLFQFFFSC